MIERASAVTARQPAFHDVMSPHLRDARDNIDQSLPATGWQYARADGLTTGQADADLQASLDDRSDREYRTSITKSRQRSNEERVHRKTFARVSQLDELSSRDCPTSDDKAS